MQKSKSTGMSEEDEQIILFRWASFMAEQHPELALMFHIPNGGKRNKAEAARFKSAGVKAGVPDIFLPAARGGWNGIFIEMKRADGGSATKAQLRMMAALERQGYLTILAHGWIAAKFHIEKYLLGEYDREEK